MSKIYFIFSGCAGGKGGQRGLCKSRVLYFFYGKGKENNELGRGILYTTQ